MPHVPARRWRAEQNIFRALVFGAIFLILKLQLLQQFYNSLVLDLSCFNLIIWIAFLRPLAGSRMQHWNCLFFFFFITGSLLLPPHLHLNAFSYRMCDANLHLTACAFYPSACTRQFLFSAFSLLPMQATSLNFIPFYNTTFFLYLILLQSDPFYVHLSQRGLDCTSTVFYLSSTPDTPLQQLVLRCIW